MSKITEQQIKFVMGKNLSCYGDNTLFLIEFYETVCESRKLEKTWENIKKIMIDDYKPEAVTRKRREFVEPSDEQLQKEQEYHEEYALNNPSTG